MIFTQTDVNVPTDDSVDTAHLKASAVTTAKIADNAVTAAKIPDNVLTATMLPDNVILATHIPNATALTLDGGVTVDNITIDGTEIDLSSGNLTLDVAGSIILNADGGQVQFHDGATEIGVFESTGNDFIMEAKVQDEDILFKGNDGGSGITAMTIDMSEAGSVGIGTTTPDSKLHILAAAAGTVDANAAAQLVIENSGDAGINLLSPNDQDNWILFGDPDDNFVGGFRYRHSTNVLHFYANNSDHMTLGSDGLLTVNEGAMIGQGALTSSSNAVAWNANTAANAYHLTTENTTFSAPSNATEGQIISVEIAQGGTAYTVAWNTVFEFAASTAPTMTATANKTDIYSFRYNGSVWQEIGRVQNMAQT